MKQILKKLTKEERKIISDPKLIGDDQISGQVGQILEKLSRAERKILSEFWLEHDDHLKQLKKRESEKIIKIMNDEKSPNVWIDKKFNEGAPFQMNGEKCDLKETKTGSLIMKKSEGHLKIKITINQRLRIQKEFFVNNKKVYKISFYPYNPKDYQWFYMKF